MLSQIFIFLSMKQFFLTKVPYVYFKYLKCWSLKDGQSRKILNNRRSRIQLSRSLCPEKILCNLFFVLFMKFTPQVSTPHRPVVCHIKCNCSKPEQPKIEVDRSHFTLSLNISAVYYTPAVILLSLLSE